MQVACAFSRLPAAHTAKQQLTRWLALGRADLLYICTVAKLCSRWAWGTAKQVCAVVSGLSALCWGISNPMNTADICTTIQCVCVPKHSNSRPKLKI